MKSLQILGLLFCCIFVGMMIKASFFPSESIKIDFQWYHGSLIPAMIGTLCLAAAMYIENKQKQKRIFKQSW